MTKVPQPMQPVYQDEDGVVRFRENAIIRYIVDHAGEIVHPGARAIDPDTGKLQWKFYTVPMNPGDPGLETWPNLEAARHGLERREAARRLAEPSEAAPG